ncbi:LytR/AlgR family response regulator transcription factor [Pseudoxanthomonas wuyuanensis]|uniref:Two component transcriptional regulator, LytTR family n=1 Tax=Pseudoxanthomonas wuyuanensis TaxID=1073196 RepID=A0A286D912_9GAMM|nr:LytTR family DNA-binding domain-containing protein [Pseudoxanthomonas wuyuanensis]KAF1722147.1 DNA-binding response regulator [Pseudoxanthomonas wuyuanensis]SOD55097.1 two component transcriptional regulator, LytTR family [Pseudoxanthomonas wuyuanensis]
MKTDAIAAVAAQRIRTLIVDDEPLARRGLELRLAEHADIEIVGQYGDGAAAVAAVHALRPDLMLLDVQMPGVDGFGTLRNIPAAEMPLVIFVTAYDHYAIRAFETSAVDYLLKPVEDSRLHQALARVRQTRAQHAAKGHCARLLGLLGQLSGRPLDLHEALQPDFLEQLRREDKLAVRDGQRTVKVDLACIRWIDAAGDYMCIHTDGDTPQGNTIILRATMRELEQQLDPQRFPRIHRSTIVNARRVVELRPHTNGESFLRLDCGQELKLSRTHRDKLAVLI